MSSRVLDFSRFCERDVDQVNDHPLDHYRIDLSKQYPRIDYLLTRNGTGCLPRGDLQVITGKQKAGKSYVLLCLEVALLRGEFMGFISTKENYRILHIDTEQHESNVSKKVSIVHLLCGLPEERNDRFIVLTLRKLSSKERLEKCIEAIEEYRPDLVVIDGIRDLCKDFNDITESADLVGILMTLCSQYQIAIMNVIHENKADKNMRGHLGTELANKSSEVYSAANDNNLIKIEQSICRNAPIDRWAFIIDAEGMPISSVGQLTLQQQKRSNALAAIFGNNENYAHTKLIDEFMKEYGCQKRAAIDNISTAIREGILIKQGNLYMLATDENDDPD